MFEYINFREYINEGKPWDGDMEEVYEHLVAKVKQHDVYHHGYSEYYNWWAIHCELNSKWYTTDSIHKHDDGDITIPDAIMTDDRPGFFGGCFIIYDNILRKTMMRLENIPSKYREKDFDINGKVQHGEYYCWYINNDDNKYYIGSEHNMEFNLSYDRDDNEILVDEIYNEYCHNGNEMLVIRSGNNIYMRANNSKHCKLIPRFPNDDEDAYSLYYDDDYFDFLNFFNDKK